MAKYQTPALDKGLDILEFLSGNAKSQSHLEIAKGINRTSNEIYRMLVCLENRGYIVKDMVSGKYQLSLRLFQMAHRHSPVDAILRASKTKLDQLAQSIGQSCHISILYQNQLMIVAQARNPGPIALSVEIGGMFPLFKTTSGKIFLSFLDEEQFLDLSKSSSHFQNLSKRKQKAYVDQLNQIRNDGFLIQKSALTEGVTDIAAPIGTSSSGIVAVLDASCLTSQIGKPMVVNTIVQEVQATIKDIVIALGLTDY